MTQRINESLNQCINQPMNQCVNRMIPVPDVTNSIPEHLAFVSSSVLMAATEVRLIFLEMGT